jgi:NADPH2:quinone reductase
MSAYKITLEHTGPADMFRISDIDLPQPADGEILIRHTAIGLNYIDTYHRTGLYPVPALPVTLGLEAAGVIESCGKKVKGLKSGDRIAYGTGPLGAYSSHRVIASDKVVKLPETITDEDAAALMLKGMTVEYLIHRTYPVKKGQTVLFHAISGGVGTIACQWLSALGVTIIGTVGSEEKAEKAINNGCDHVIRYDKENVAERVMEITQDKGVPVVYDSVGKDTFESSLDCLSPRGMMVSFGQSSGPVESFNPAVLAQKGSLFYTRPSLMDYTKTRKDLEQSTQRVFDALKKKHIRVDIGQRYGLKDIVQAHKDLQARRTIGATILIP